MKKVKLVLFILVLGFSLAGMELISDPLNTADAQSPYASILEQISTKADQGKTLNSEHFGVGNQVQEVISGWGKPDFDSGQVISYQENRHILMIYKHTDPDKPILSVEDQDPRIQSIPLKKVKKQLGTPFEEIEQEGLLYVTYLTDNQQYRFTFVYTIPMDPGHKEKAFLYYVESH